MKEVFQCKYVRPDEALGRFQKILALTQSPFDFKIVLSDDSSGEESSFQVKGGIDEMFEKFKVFLETSTGYAFVAVPTETEIIDFDENSMLFMKIDQKYINFDGQISSDQN